MPGRDTALNLAAMQTPREFCARRLLVTVGMRGRVLWHLPVRVRPYDSVRRVRMHAQISSRTLPSRLRCRPLAADSEFPVMSDRNLGDETLAVHCDHDL